MPVVDPYAPCPCGSGEKYKWCCQKIEQYTDRSQRLFENGQLDAALEVLAEGLRKEPGNAWLQTRQALILFRQNKPEQARPILERIVARQPGHQSAQALLVQVLAATEGSRAAAAQLQDALAACPVERTPALFLLIRLVGLMLAEVNDVVAALAYLRLAFRFAAREEDARFAAAAIGNLSASPSSSPYTRNDYILSPAPAGLSPAHQELWADAHEYAEDGRWEGAAEMFEQLAKEGAGPLADRNAGLCRIRFADHDRGLPALRRFIAKAGETAEAIDLEALCQSLAPFEKDGVVESVRLIWPLRDRERLLAALRGSADVFDAGEALLDPDDESSPQVDEFQLLDRPVPAPGATPERGKLPRIVAYAYVGQEIAVLEAYDDETLDPLSDRFTSLAGTAIAPAQPRTKVMGQTAKFVLPFVAEYWMPAGIEPSAEEALKRAEIARVIRDVWPNTPQPYLGGRTPAQAAKAGNARVPLRAALLSFEVTSPSPAELAAISEVRQALGLPEEPDFDPAGLDIEAVNLARLHFVPAEKLDDDALIVLFERTRVSLAARAVERAALAIIERPALFADPRKIDVATVYGALSSIALHHDPAAALEWVKKGREADPPSQRSEHAPKWDMLEIRARIRLQPPEEWVPELAVVLERYAGNSTANQVILSGLIDMGLVQLAPHPDGSGTMLADARLLEAMLAQYGPRITTASGQVGVSASKGGIWTPGSDTPSGAGSGLWTPGAGSAPGPAGGGEKPKLIVPGR